MRVTVAPATPEDRDEFLAASRASVRLHGDWVVPKTTLAEVDQMFARGAQPNACLLLARRVDDGSLVGWFMLSEIVRGAFQNAFVGYAAFAGAEGQGLMTEAMRLVVRYGFEELGLHRIEANVQPDNGPSIGLVRRAGFRLEGYSPQYLKIAGAWRDHERWAITSGDAPVHRPRHNRSIPAAAVIPVLIYPDVRAAVEWLCRAFGFSERVRIGENHRSQLRYGDGGLIVGDVRGERVPPRPGEATHSVMVRVADAGAHCEHARAQGATILMEPTEFEYGERQYSARDPWGHQWTFSETIADVAPETWGGESVS